MSRKRTATTIAAALAFLAGGTVRAEPPAKSRTGRVPTAAEFEALKKRVDEQSELIMKLTQLEGAHYEYLIKLLQSGARAGGAPIALATVTSIPLGVSWGERGILDGDTTAKARVATISGRVDVSGKPRAPVYVYVDNIKEPATDRTVEITQKDRSFVPNFLVVQRGTHVVFPNADPFLHNVFSPSPTSPFDLGSYRQGEKPGTVRLFNAGVVEVLCNMHAKMRADILVVPNRHHAKVNGDGSFRLDNVPIGARTVVAWTPDAKPVTTSVTLTPAGASANFALKVEPAGVPLDKTGKPRPAYRNEE